jgi:hypothetical protein
MNGRREFRTVTGEVLHALVEHRTTQMDFRFKLVLGPIRSS